MTHREELMEKYEDALFELLMDEVAQVEGEKAIQLNEKLNLDPQYAVPVSVQKRCEKAIRSSLAKQEHKRVGKRVFKVFQRVSVAAMTAMLLFTTAFAVSEPVRRWSLNALLTINEEFGEIQFTEDRTAQTPPPADPDQEYHYNIGLEYVPEGYEVADGRMSSDGGGSVTYMDQNGNNIRVSVRQFSSSDIYHFDTEDADIQSVQVQGNNAQLITKQVEATGEIESYTERSVIWADSVQQLQISVYASSLTEEEVLQVAEGVRWSE